MRNSYGSFAGTAAVEINTQAGVDNIQKEVFPRFDDKQKAGAQFGEVITKHNHHLCPLQGEGGEEDPPFLSFLGRICYQLENKSTT
jgi:hypothetical protein